VSFLVLFFVFLIFFSCIVYQRNNQQQYNTITIFTTGNQVGFLNTQSKSSPATFNGKLLTI